MDVTIRTNSGAPLITPWSARGMSNDKYNLLTKADEKKRTIETVASKAFESPVMKAADKDKSFIREKIEGIKKRLQILRKLFSGNPKEMAKALAQVFKELKAALKDYKAATDKEIGASAGAVDAMMPADVAMAPPADATADDASKDDTAKDTDAAPEEASATDEPAQDPAVAIEQPTAAAEPAPPLADPAVAAAPHDEKHALYGQIAEKVKTMAGEDGLEFTKEIKGLVQWIEDKMLTPARIQMKAKKPDKDTDKAFEDVDKELKALKKEMEDIERDIKREAPAVGQHLDVAA